MSNEDLIPLSCKEYPVTHKATKKGQLWVVINDADLFRIDNVGFFMLKLIKHSGPFTFAQSESNCRDPER